MVRVGVTNTIRRWLGWESTLVALGPGDAAASSPPETMRVRRRAQGGTGTRIFGGRIDDLDPNRDLRGPKWYGEPGKLGISHRMMRDPHVRKSIDYVIRPLQAATWFYKPTSREPIDLEIARACDFAFLERFDIAEIMRLSLGVAARDGVALLEMTDDAVPVSATQFPILAANNNGQAVMPTGFHQRPAWTVTKWNQDKSNPACLKSIEQFIQGSDGERAKRKPVDANRMLRWTVDQEAGDFTGLSLLRSAYGAWKLKITFQTIDAIRHERQGVGIPMLELPPEVTPEDLVAAEQILEEMRANDKGYAIWPNGYTFKWATTDGVGTGIEAAIERCNRDIAYNVGAGFMLLGLNGKHGSFALAQSQDGQYHVGLNFWAKFFARPFNYGSDGWNPTERFVRMNYGPDVAVPKLFARNLPTVDWSKILAQVPALVSANVLTPDDPMEDAIREYFVLPPRDPESAREKPTSVIAMPTTPEPTEPEPDPDNEDDEEETDDAAA